MHTHTPSQETSPNAHSINKNQQSPSKVDIGKLSSLLHVGEVTPVNQLRSLISQLIACMSPNLLLFDLGMTIGFTTIALPDLLNATEGLSLDESQASWFGSISYLTQPFGALLSGPIVDYFGRKKSNFLVNIPHLVAWTLMYFSWNLPSLFIANGLLGFGTGVMEAPVNSYVGEISEPSLRGALCTITQLFASVGVFAMYFLGTVAHWRQIALVCLAAPIASMLLVFVVPETPVWLLWRGREKDALKSLCYLRGWTSADSVREEFDDLVVYSKKLHHCPICYKTEGQVPVTCSHSEMNWFRRSALNFKYVMLCKDTLRPWTLVMLYFTFYVMSGFNPIRPNMVNICGAFGMPDKGQDIVLMVGIITLVTSVMVVGLIKIIGKRKLAISAMFGTAVSCIGLSIYANHNLASSVFSYNSDTFPKETSYVPMVLFYCMTVFTGFGIPWVLLGEVFPFRSRASAQGIAAAGNYVIMFIGSKTFISIEMYSGLWGAFAVYAAFGLAGTIYLYFFLPETEGKSLQEIESYYNGELKTFADDPCINLFRRFIRKRDQSNFNLK